MPIATRWIYLECYSSWETLGWQLNSREEHYKIVFCFPLEIVPSIFFTTLCTLPSIHWELRLQDNIFFLQFSIKKKLFAWFQRHTGIKSATFSAFGHMLNLIPSDMVDRRIRGLENSNQILTLTFRAVSTDADFKSQILTSFGKVITCTVKCFLRNVLATSVHGAEQPQWCTHWLGTSQVQLLDGAAVPSPPTLRSSHFHLDCPLSLKIVVT